MKKSLLALFIAAALFAGCQKDTSTKVTIGTSDLTAINGQLKGTWLFPVETLNVVDSTGKSLQASQNLPSPALQFDGSSGVKIMTDSKTTLKGTYKLSTTNGGIYVDLNYPDGTTQHLQVMLLTNQTLKLSSSQPYVAYQGSKPITAQAVATTVLQRQTSADVTSNSLRVTVISDSLYNVKVYLNNQNVSAKLVDSGANITGAYSYSCVAKYDDRLGIDVKGSLTKTTVNAYYNGLPFGQSYESQEGEITTSGDWVIH